MQTTLRGLLGSRLLGSTPSVALSTMANQVNFMDYWSPKGADAITLYECSLLGICENSSGQNLVDRLTGLTEQSRDALNYLLPIREVCYRRKQVASQSAIDSDLVQGTQTRARSRFESESDGKKALRTLVVLFADTPRTLVHYGSSVSRDGLSAHCRPVVEVEVGSDIETFLEAMGFEYQFEFVTRVLLFHALLEKSRQPFYTNFCQIQQVKQRGDIETATDFSENYLVELVGFSNDADLIEVCKELNAFATKLFPYVLMVSMDPATRKRLKDEQDKKKNLTLS